jgi:hypothetical protein
VPTHIQKRLPKGTAKGGQFAPDMRAKNNIPTPVDYETAEPILTNRSTTPPTNYSDIHTRFSHLTGNQEWVLEQPIKKQIEIVSDSETSASLIKNLAHNPKTSPVVLIELMKNKKTDPQTLAFLSKNKNTAVRCWAAWDENLPVVELDRLSKDNDVNVRQGVAEHPETPKNILFALGSKYSEEDRFVRQRARDHKNYPKKNERLSLAKSRNVDAPTLYTLSGDALPQIANIAKQRLAKMGHAAPVFEEDE